MAKQIALLPRGAGDQKRREFLAEWIRENYGRTTDLPRGEILRRLFNGELPRPMWATHDQRDMQWVTRAVGQDLRRLGYEFTDGQGGDRLDMQLLLPLDDFLACQVGKAFKDMADQRRRERDIERYCVFNNLEVAPVLAQFRTAVGL